MGENKKGARRTGQRAIVLFNRNLPTRCHKTFLRAFVRDHGHVGCCVHIQ